jgi:hypothetical protein
VIKTVAEGEEFPAKFGRVGLRRNFTFENIWRGRNYKSKQLEVYGLKEDNELLNASEQLQIIGGGKFILTNESTGKTMELPVGIK